MNKSLFKLRKVIHATTEVERTTALNELYPDIMVNVKATLEVMDGFPVTIRLLDPPLHEFTPQSYEDRVLLAESLGISMSDLEKRISELHEVNPMMGHRGVRLGITFPGLTEMQIKAIMVASAELIKAGKNPKPEIMIPVVVSAEELKSQRVIFDAVKAEVEAQYDVEIACLFGTMIETPRACLQADKLSQVADFFSVGTNDLTQMTFGFSRDDVNSFLPEYIDKGIVNADPFQTLDASVGELIEVAVDKGRKTRPELKIGICGEHGGEEKSIAFCHNAGINYVSCSPYRIPIAKLAAAKAAIAQ